MTSRNIFTLRRAHGWAGPRLVATCYTKRWTFVPTYRLLSHFNVACCSLFWEILLLRNIQSNGWYPHVRGYLRLFHLQLINLIILKTLRAISGSTSLTPSTTYLIFLFLFLTLVILVCFTKDQQVFVTQSDSLAQRNSLCTTVNLLTSLQN